MRRWSAAALAALLLAACGAGPGDDATPTASTDAPAPSSAELTAARGAAERAGVRPCPETPPGAVVDDGLPDLLLACLGDGPDVRLSGLRGPAVVNLWASWCGPCREELPLLARLDTELGDELTVIGIDVQDDAPEAAVRLAADAGVRYPLLFDPKATTRAPLRVAGLPQTVFVDEQGTMVATERTPYRSYRDLTDAVRRHLEVTP